MRIGPWRILNSAIGWIAVSGTLCSLSGLIWAFMTAPWPAALLFFGGLYGVTLFFQFRGRIRYRHYLEKDGYI